MCVSSYSRKITNSTFDTFHRSSTREPDQGISEAVCAVIYAAPRTELKGPSFIVWSPKNKLKTVSVESELHVLREILMHKYGREFAVAVMENKDGCVSERVSIGAPSSLNINAL